MTKSIIAFGVFTAVVVAGAFFFNTKTSAQGETLAPEVVTTSSCGKNQSCGCSSAGECGQSTCTTRKSSCGCGSK